MVFNNFYNIEIYNNLYNNICVKNKCIVIRITQGDTKYVCQKQTTKLRIYLR